jgi:hypothetical protein
MRFFRSYAFASGVASSFFFYASMYGILFFLPQFLQTAQGHAPFGAGVRLLPWTATLFVVAPVAGKLVNRIGERPLVVTGLILQALGMAWIGLIVAPNLAYVQLVAPLILAGAGVSMAMPAAQNSVLSSVAGGEIGKASGTFNMLGVRHCRPRRRVRAHGKLPLCPGVQRRLCIGDWRLRQSVGRCCNCRLVVASWRHGTGKRSLSRAP